MGALLNLEKKDIDKFSHSTPAKWLNEKIWDNFTPIPQPKNAKAKKVRAVEMSAVQQPAHPARPKSAALGRRSQAQPMDDNPSKSSGSPGADVAPKVVIKRPNENRVWKGRD